MLVYMWSFILTKMFLNPGCEKSVRLTNITSITANTNKVINNLWIDNSWIRIFVRKCLTQFIAGENYFDFDIFAKSFTEFFNFVLRHFRIHSYERKFKIPPFNIRHLHWHASCICLIDSILEILLYDIVFHAKRMLFLKYDVLEVFKINIKTCPSTTNPIQTIN